MSGGACVLCNNIPYCVHTPGLYKIAALCVPWVQTNGSLMTMRMQGLAMSHHSLLNLVVSCVLNETI